MENKTPLKCGHPVNQPLVLVPWVVPDYIRGSSLYAWFLLVKLTYFGNHAEPHSNSNSTLPRLNCQGSGCLHGNNLIFALRVAPIIQINPVDIFIPMNSEATFTCVIDSEPGSVVEITWSGPDPALLSSVNTEQSGIVTSNLTINVTDGLYEGQFYNCSVEYSNCLMVVNSSSAAFFIILIPIVIQSPLSGAFDIGDSLTLTCAATTNYGTLSITWSGPMPDLQATDTLVSANNRTSSLDISIFNYTFGGLYTCVATNEAGTYEASAIIFVRPVVVPTMILASDGEPVSLTCEVQSFPNSTIRWEKQTSLLLFEVVLDELELELQFSPVRFGDQGTYRCVATSEEFGEQVSSTTSLITGK